MTDIQIPTNNINNEILLNEREKAMEQKCNEIAENLFKFKNRFNMSNIILQSNYKIDENSNKILNNNFDNIELIEENLDELFYVYQLIKEKIADTRKDYLEIQKINKKLSN